MASLRDKITGWNNPLTQSDQKKDSKEDKAISIKTSAEDNKEAHLAFNAQRDSSRAKLAQYNSKKAHLHQNLISRIDLSSLENLSSKELRQKIRDVVTKLISEEGLTINDQERQEIIIDLQNEVLGLGLLRLSMKTLRTLI
jgi:pilus assembly protein CpaF